MRPLLLRHPFALAIVAMPSAACSANVVAAGTDANASSTQALLVVERNAPADGAGDGARAHASMWFLRSADEQSLEAAKRLVTDVLELPRVGECAALGSRRVEPPASSATPVELAFAGDVFVEAAGSRVQLAMRAFPDVANLVSGVVYTAPGQSDLALSPSGRLLVGSSGSDGLAPMEAQVEAPASPAGVEVDGAPLGSTSLEARRGRPLMLRWQPGTARDLVYVDVDPVPGSPGDRVRCAMADTGAGVVSAMAIPETPALSMAVHRVRVTPLRASAGEVGTAHFDLAVTGRVKVASP
jgi:hypothetical protein